MFQFTHPGRGATQECRGSYTSSRVSIHAPREGCDLAGAPSRACRHVSIHAPREGCDYQHQALLRPSEKFQFTHPGRGATSDNEHRYTPKEFQFTHPGRGATQPTCSPRAMQMVSIHAPREGCDREEHLSLLDYGCFNSRTPGGVRLVLFCVVLLVRRFQFTHPGRGATAAKASTSTTTSGFNSRTPGGVRPP